jgi:hypothetical protein
MSDESIAVDDGMNKLQEEHDQLMNALGLPHLDVRTNAPFGKLTLRERLRWSGWWIPSTAVARWLVLGAVVIGALVYAGYGLGRAAPPRTDAQTDVRRSAGLPAVNDADVFTAPAKDSLRQTILDGNSSVVLAPRSSLALGKMVVAPNQIPVYEARLAGSVRLEIRGATQAVVVRTTSGSATIMGPGRFDVSATPDALVGRTYTGGILMKTPGIFAALGRRIYPGLEGRAERGHMVQVRRFVP